MPNVIVHRKKDSEHRTRDLKLLGHRGLMMLIKAQPEGFQYLKLFLGNAVPILHITVHDDLPRIPEQVDERTEQRNEEHIDDIVGAK
jgi:hypothetical protein